ncbi:DUF397 domain-containing protein [Streptomyces sp. NPDC050549]
MAEGDPRAVHWRKSSYSNSGGDCVEVAYFDTTKNSRS